MKPDMFKQPISVLVGPGFPTRICSALDAYRYRSECPQYLRDVAHSMALKACNAALRGDVEAETARGVFAAFAEKHDLLGPETLTVVAAQNRGGSSPHVQ